MFSRVIIIIIIMLCVLGLRYFGVIVGFIGVDVGVVLVGGGGVMLLVLLGWGGMGGMVEDLVMCGWGGYNG